MTVVFSKSYCPYCNATKKLLSDHGAKYYVMELDQVGSLHPLPPHFRLTSESVDWSDLTPVFERV